MSELEVVPVDGKPLKLDPVGLAMGTALVQSRKRKRDMIDNAYFRYSPVIALTLADGWRRCACVVLVVTMCSDWWWLAISEHRFLDACGCGE